MPRKPSKYHSSPTLNVHITDEQYVRAKKSRSGACLISDAIKAQYPHLSFVATDMATVRATDQKKGLRYIYLTPPLAQQVLLHYDQGWPNPVEHLTIRGAVKIEPITRHASQTLSREERLAELEGKLEAGEPLTTYEKRSLAQLTRPPRPRPSAAGPATVMKDSTTRRPVVVGGRPTPNASHPNLLRGSDRHFGARLADPGEVFAQAVSAEVDRRLGQQT